MLAERLRAAVLRAVPAFLRAAVDVCLRAREAADRFGAEADDSVLLALAEEAAPP
ncbi:MAG: hypothetical protein H5U29_04870, partial [Pusillimonas sp.]|nr:hypothetical protein [Pusillimonas sp.]